MVPLSDNPTATSMAGRDARGVVYVGLAVLAHLLIWASVPAAFAVAATAALILIERLAGELTDTIVGVVAANRTADGTESTGARSLRAELSSELLGPVVSIGMAAIAAAAGLILKPWFAPVLTWFDA